MPCIALVLSGERRLRWSVADLPVQVPVPHSRLRLHSESAALSPRHPTVLLVSRQTGRRASEEEVISVRSLCHPLLRERTLQRLSGSGGLQALIDQWGRSSLEELEDFIDSYFETVWEQTMGSAQAPEPERPAAELDAAIRRADEEEVLCSIDRKLSKLELLEEIRRDLAEMRLSQESSWRAIQELRDQSKKSPDNTS